MHRAIMASVFAVVLAINAASANDVRVDLELVLAVDASASVTGDEQYLQRQGYVAAFQSPQILNAIRSGQLRRIAVAYVEWGDAKTQSLVLPWMLIEDKTSAMEFAFNLADRPINHFFGTSLAGALIYSADLFDANGFRGDRQVIDISADGPNNVAPPVVPARDSVLARGITVNGLPVMTNVTFDSGLRSIEGLDWYFHDCVIGGPGAFVIAIRRREDFATAIRQKLVLDIVGPKPEPQPIAFETRPSRVDCLAGEKGAPRLIPQK